MPTFAEKLDRCTVLSALDPFLPELCATVVDALQDTRDLLTSAGLLGSANFHAHTFRMFLLKRLETSHLAALCKCVEEQGDGVHIIYGQYETRVLKDPFVLPVRTVHTAKWVRYCQQLALSTDPNTFPFLAEAASVRLFLYWQVDRALRLQTLVLLCPEGAGDEQRPDALWEEDVRYLVGQVTIPTDESTEEIDAPWSAFGDDDIDLPRKPIPDADRKDLG